MANNYLDKTGLIYLWGKIKAALAGKSNTDHTHNYAGSSSAGGAANSAVKLQTARTIDGVDFNGASAIAHYGTPRQRQQPKWWLAQALSWSLVRGSSSSLR